LQGGAEGLAEGLSVTGHFLHHHLAPSLGDRPLPAARDRLAEWLSRG
jgi:DNA repair protein RecO (recombination protein O)